MTAISGSPIRIYLLAGVATTKGYFDECRNQLDRMFRADGREPIIHILHPYGDVSRNLYRQIVEVGTDLTNRLSIGRIGGRAAFQQVKETMKSEEEPILFIGHSGGGAAAYQAGKMLHQQRLNRNFRIVQVGSPRIPIHPELRDKVCFLHSVDKEGKLSDPISRIGTWGGWSAQGASVPRWNRFKYSPSIVEGIPLIGGHAHYFCHQTPYVDQDSVCNLDKTINRVRNWLLQSWT